MSLLPVNIVAVYVIFAGSGCNSVCVGLAVGLTVGLVVLIAVIVLLVIAYRRGLLPVSLPWKTGETSPDSEGPSSNKTVIVVTADNTEEDHYCRIDNDYKDSTPESPGLGVYLHLDQPSLVEAAP